MLPPIFSGQVPAISDRAVQFLSHFKRRNAILRPVARIKGHEIKPHLLTEPTYCAICTEYIWVVVGQRCTQCKLTLHRKCLSVLNSGCSLSDEREVVAHDFVPNFFWQPTCCRHCGTLLKGIIGPQGVLCNDCGLTAHHDCKSLICHPCNEEKNPPSKTAKKGPRLQISGTAHSQPGSQQKNRLEDYDLLSLLGTGTFSKVYLAYHRPSRHKYAIKVVRKCQIEEVRDPLAEKRVLNLGRKYNGQLSSKHPFLTIAHCCFQTRDRLFFVMEYVEGRELVYHIGKARKFTEERVRFYAAEIVLALIFLHKEGVIYRDLKLENIILDRYGHCKLVDFGLSKELSMSASKARTFCGTPNYISPEMIKEQYYDYSVDWWALGVLLFEMLMGYSPFEAEDEDRLKWLITNVDISVPYHLSHEAKSIVEGLLTKDPQNRLGCQLMEGREKAILKHPFFRCDEEKWRDIELMKIKPPYTPEMSDCLDGKPSSGICLSPINSDQPGEEFEGFSFCAESFIYNY